MDFIYNKDKYEVQQTIRFQEGSLDECKSEHILLTPTSRVRQSSIFCNRIKNWKYYQNNGNPYASRYTIS